MTIGVSVASHKLSSAFSFFDIALESNVSIRAILFSQGLRKSRKTLKGEQLPAGRVPGQPVVNRLAGGMPQAVAAYVETNVPESVGQ